MRADPAPTGATTELSDARLLEMLQQMIEIREFEDEVQRAFTKDLIRGSTHLCTGQEACPVGACAASDRGRLDGLHVPRAWGGACHGGAARPIVRRDVRRESRPVWWQGRVDAPDRRRRSAPSGPSRSSERTCRSRSALGWAAQHDATGAVSLCFFGDGAANIGAFHEAMNLAAIWKLPVIFVCENNLYGEYSRVAVDHPARAARRPRGGLRHPGVEVDGNDVVAVHAVRPTAVERARQGDGPTFIEA